LKCNTDDLTFESRIDQITDEMGSQELLEPSERNIIYSNTFLGILNPNIEINTKTVLIILQRIKERHRMWNVLGQIWAVTVDLTMDKKVKHVLTYY
jgi:hypothetical protein